MPTVSVNHGDASSGTYNIHIGRELLGDFVSFIPFDLKGRSLFVLTDENTTNPYGMSVYQTLKSSGAHSVQILTLPAGEQTKSMAALEQVLSWLLDHGVGRDSVLFTVGGGVIGDLGGFAAAVILRGISFVQIPTTLLAQVDSAVGGKTGLDMAQGKNLVGAFHQPVSVVCDMDVLETLPRRELLSGYAEIVKYALIDDPAFFVWLEKNGQGVCEREPEALARAIELSCRKKAEIVEADEKEQNVRALLNLGHTFAHALEAAAAYDGRLLHGEAVAIGMVLAFRLSVCEGHCPEEDAKRVEVHLAAMGLPTAIHMIFPPLDCDAVTLMALMKRDKKVEKGQNHFVVLRGIGKAYISADVDWDIVEQVITDSMEGV